MSAHLLLVTHEATRTGAPRIALNWARWLVEHTDVDLEILALRGGPLLEEFDVIAPTHLVRAFGRENRAFTVEAGLSRAGLSKAATVLHLARLRWGTRGLRRPDAVWLNSANSARALRILHGDPVVVSHLHEMASSFNHWFAAGDRRRMIETTDEFVVASAAVRRHLLDHDGVRADRVHVHHEFIDPPRLTDADRARGAHLVGRDSRSTAIVGAIGTADWRKGADLFVQLAGVVNRLRPDAPVRFVWVGGAGDGQGFAPLEHDVRSAGLGDLVAFVGEVDDARPAISEMDLVCIPSREDAFPLVALEAGALGVPSLVFENCGLVELNRDGVEAVAVVPYLDVEAMARRVVDLLDDAGARAALGAAARDRVRAEHFTDAIAPRLLALLNQALPDSNQVRLR